MAVSVHAFTMAHAGDADGLRAALPGVAGTGALVLLAKVPGPATLNDPSRELAQTVFRAALAGRPCTMILSVGCEGVGSAGGWLLAGDGEGGGAEPRLCVGVAGSEPIPVADRGTDAQVATVAAAVTRAMAQAGLAAEQVQLVLVKNPVRRDQEGATGRARGAAALGVALALGEATGPRLGDPAQFCRRAMTMSGTETGAAEIVVLGNRPGAGGDLVVGSGLLADILDIGGARRTLRNLGAGFDADGVLAEPLPLVLFKAGLRADGVLRGRATHVHGTDIPADKHLRAAASGMLGALLGSTAAFVTGGAEHQAPPGGCLLAAVARA